MNNKREQAGIPWEEGPLRRVPTFPHTRVNTVGHTPGLTLSATHPGYTHGAHTPPGLYPRCTYTTRVNTVGYPTPGLTLSDTQHPGYTSGYIYTTRVIPQDTYTPPGYSLDGRHLPGYSLDGRHLPGYLGGIPTHPPWYLGDTYPPTMVPTYTPWVYHHAALPVSPCWSMVHRCSLGCENRLGSVMRLITSMRRREPLFLPKV